MTTLREAALIALGALEHIDSPLHVREIDKVGKAINNLRKALDADSMASLPKTVAWIWVFYDMANDRYVRRIIDCEERPNIQGVDLIPLYTTQPKREWQSLTDEEIKDIWCWDEYLHSYQKQMIEDIQAKLKEKNT